MPAEASTTSGTVTVSIRRSRLAAAKDARLQERQRHPLRFFRFSEFLRRRRPSLTVIFFRISASYGHDEDRATHLFPGNPSHINNW
jgi:hypothetical protein